MPPHPPPTADDLDELLLSCRYGELDEIRAFVDQFGTDAAQSVRDERGNTVLHMVCANGHADALAFLLPLLPPALALTPNLSASLPLHWATTNRHLPILKLLIGAAGPAMVGMPNGAGQSALGLAEEDGWEEGASWLVGVMELNVDVDGAAGAGGTEPGVREGETEEAVEEEDVGREAEEGQPAAAADGMLVDLDPPAPSSA